MHWLTCGNISIEIFVRPNETIWWGRGKNLSLSLFQWNWNIVIHFSSMKSRNFLILCSESRGMQFNLPLWSFLVLVVAPIDGISANDVRSPEFRQMPTQQQTVSLSRGNNDPTTELATKSNSFVRMVGVFQVSISRRSSAGMTGLGVDPSHDAVSSTNSNCLQNKLVSYWSQIWYQTGRDGKYMIAL